MIREVDLVDYYLPPFMQAYKEPVATLDAEQPEFQLVWKASDRVLYNHFISTADEFGIARFEKILNILPSVEDSLEDRRARVQNRWFNVAPYTMRVLVKKVSDLLGGDHNFSIWADFTNEYILMLTVYSTNDSQVEEIKYLLDTVVPMNIVTDIIYESTHDGGLYFGVVTYEADIIELKQR